MNLNVCVCVFLWGGGLFVCFLSFLKQLCNFLRSISPLQFSCLCVCVYGHTRLGGATFDWNINLSRKGRCLPPNCSRKSTVLALCMHVAIYLFVFKHFSLKKKKIFFAQMSHFWSSILNSSEFVEMLVEKMFLNWYGVKMGLNKNMFRMWMFVPPLSWLIDSWLVQAARCSLLNGHRTIVHIDLHSKFLKISARRVSCVCVRVCCRRCW